jgi:hypothetical protein
MSRVSCAGHGCVALPTFVDAYLLSPFQDPAARQFALNSRV